MPTKAPRPKWLTGPGEIVTDDGGAGNRRQDAAAVDLPKIETGDRATGPAIINTQAEWRTTAGRGIRTAGRATNWVFRGRNPWKMAFFIVTFFWVVAMMLIPALAYFSTMCATSKAINAGGVYYTVDYKLFNPGADWIAKTVLGWFLATGIYALSAIFTLAGWFAFGKK